MLPDKFRSIPISLVYVIMGVIFTLQHTIQPCFLLAKCS